MDQTTFFSDESTRHSPIERLPKNSEKALFERILTKVSMATGEEFLNELARSLSFDLGWDHVCVARLNDDGTRACTVRLHVDGKFAENLEYDLAGTPCDIVLSEGWFCVRDGVAAQFPLDTLLRRDRLRSYVGHIIPGPNGRPAGVLSLMKRAPCGDTSVLERLLPILSARVGAEFERQDQDARLRESETRLRFLMEELRKQHDRQNLHVQQTPLGVIEFDLAGRFVSWNPAAERIFGYPRQAVLGRHMSLIIPEDQKAGIDTIWDRLLEQKGGFRSTNYNVRADGERVFCEWYNTPLVSSDGNTVGVASLVQDITEVTRAEQLLESQRLQMMTTAKMSALGEMAAGIAHEINNPLAIIFGRVEQLERLSRKRNELPSAEVVDLAKRIGTTAERIARIVSGLRFFAREGSGDAFERKRIRELVEETLTFCQSRFRHHGIELIVEIPDDANVQCRSVQISQVLLNLLNNAFDAVENLSERWVRITYEDGGTEARLRVTDSGPGIPRDLLNKIMTPFFTTKEVGKGTGLGLSISRGILEAHNGRIEVDTASPNTSFVITLPKNVSRELRARRSRAAHSRRQSQPTSVPFRSDPV